MNAGCNKLFLPLAGQMILKRTVSLFSLHPQVDHIYLVFSQEDWRSIHLFANDVKITLVEGGTKRQDSVDHALQAITQQSKEIDIVLVHDGARPFCSPTLISQIIEQTQITGAVIPVTPLKDTIRKIDKRGMALLDRSVLYATQTPQGFRFSLLQEANEYAKSHQLQVTDDASLVEQLGHPVTTILGEEDNLKITTPNDLVYASFLLQQKSIDPI